MYTYVYIIYIYIYIYICVVVRRLDERHERLQVHGGLRPAAPDALEQAELLLNAVVMLYNDNNNDNNHNNNNSSSSSSNNDNSNSNSNSKGNRGGPKEVGWNIGRHEGLSM